MSGDRRTSPVPEVKRISWSRRQRALGAVKVVLVVTLLSVGAASASSWVASSETCAGCHVAVQPVHATHQDIGCASCHRPRGASGAVRFAVSWSRMAVNGYVLGQHPERSEGPRAQIDQSSCTSCHAALFRDDSEIVAGVRVYHEHLLGNGVRCERCHEGLGHADTSRGDRHVMSECMRCHGDAAEKVECGSCHVGRPSDVVSDTRLLHPVWIEGDGTCNGCHRSETARECVACHGGYEMPHPVGWGNAHYYDGFTDQQACFECHSPPRGVNPAPHGSASGGYGGSFCNRCHSYPTPHPPAAQWVRQHGPASRGVQIPHPVCAGCHGDAPYEYVSNCQGCHHTQHACDTCHAERDARRDNR